MESDWRFRFATFLQAQVNGIKLSIDYCSQITLNWREKPLTSYEVVVNLIAATNNSKGLRVKCMLDTNKYPTGTKIEKKQVE